MNKTKKNIMMNNVIYGNKIIMVALLNIFTMSIKNN